MFRTKQPTHEPFMCIDTLAITEQTLHPARFYYVPLVAKVFDYSTYSKNGGTIRDFDGDHKRPFFVAYCNRNEQREREELFRILKLDDEKNTVHALGRCSHTEGIEPVAGAWNSGELISRYSLYRFAFAMENSIANQPGVISEKIINAYKSGAIPIYWGHAATTKECFNPKSFVCVNDFPSLVECADFMKKLDNDPVRYNAMLNEPMFTGRVVPPLMNVGDQSCPADTYVRLGKCIVEKVIISRQEQTN